MTKRHIMQSAAALLLLLAMLLLSLYSNDAINGAACGITLCLTHIIPSTFPFLAVAEIISCYFSQGGGRLIPALLVGNISGYPVGGRLCCQLDLRGKERLLSLVACVGAGPGFTVAAVGTGVLKSSGAGVLLYVSQLLTSLTAAGVLFFLRMRSKSSKKRVSSVTDSSLPFPVALVNSTKAACLSCLHICGFVTLFSCIIGVLEGIAGQQSGIVGMLISGILEVSNGCGRASLIYGVGGFAVVGGLLGFGGLSVFCQLYTITREHGIGLKELFLSRAVSGLLGGLYSALLYISFPSCIPTAAFDTHLNKTSLHPLSLTVTLCVMLGVLLCADRKTGGVRLFDRKESHTA